MTKAEEQALKNHTFIGLNFYEIERLKEEFLAGYRQAVSDVIDLIENGEGFDIVAGYGERCELIDAIKKFIE